MVRKRTIAGLAGFAALMALIPWSAQADQVFLDDVIVEGSLCVGLDCSNGESFGFDTIRLKENNLRINFEDTSASASFPTNDWQLQANETSNGGKNWFTILDDNLGRRLLTVEAGAPNNAMFLDDRGNLGLSTDSPAVEFEIRDGDTPTVRLNQDGSSGFTPQTWDLAGNETNFFVRDVTNGSTLPFRIRPSAPSDSLVISGNGDVGVGTDSPSNKFHVREAVNGETKFLVENNNAQWQFTVADNSQVAPNVNGELRISAQGTGGPELTIRQDGSFKVGVGGTTEFSIDAAGNVTINGDVDFTGSCNGNAVGAGC